VPVLGKQAKNLTPGYQFAGGRKDNGEPEVAWVSSDVDAEEL
jgi:hypothetical protein